MTSILINRLQVMGPDGMDEAYKYYRSVVTEEGYVNQIAPSYEAASKLAAGAQAPEIEFEDLDGDGVITEGDRYMTGKSPAPKFYYGINLKLSWKDWDFGLNGHGAAGTWVFNDFASANSTECSSPRSAKPTRRL